MGINMQESKLKGAFYIDAFSVGDKRGSFTKYFEIGQYALEGIQFHVDEAFVSVSEKNVVRGLHFQLQAPQAKIVTVICGCAWDVFVDLRKGSSSYKKWDAIELSAGNHRAVYIPRGFAHGFVSLEDNTTMLYLCDGRYDEKSDTGIKIDEPEFKIDWPIRQELMIRSERDRKLMAFKDYDIKPMKL